MGSLKRDKTVWVRGEMPSLARFFFRSPICNSLLIPFGSTLTTNFHHKSRNEIKSNLPHDAASRVHATERIPQRQRHDPFVAKVPTMQMDTMLQGLKQVEQRAPYPIFPDKRGKRSIALGFKIGTRTSFSLKGLLEQPLQVSVVNNPFIHFVLFVFASKSITDVCASYLA